MSLHTRLTLLLVVAVLPSHSRQEPTCQMKVVSCNYAYLYSGQFSWDNTLKGPSSEFHEQVTVGVKKGVADCLGSVKDTNNGQTTAGTISGPGLFAVEFERDSANKLVYRITAACPTAANMGSPVQRAELGHHDLETDPHPATAVGQNELQGGSSRPAPESDPANGVTGTLQVTWKFTRPARVPH